MIDVTVNVDNLKAGIDAFVGRLTDAVPISLMKTADRAMLESQRQVPLDTGWLQNSGSVELEGSGVVLGYHAPYAAYQHEGMRADGTHVVHNWQHGRKKKFISDPINDESEQLLIVFGENIKARVMP